jgi:hypothetical protein
VATAPNPGLADGHRDAVAVDLVSYGCSESMFSTRRVRPLPSAATMLSMPPAHVDAALGQRERDARQVQRDARRGRS